METNLINIEISTLFNVNWTGIPFFTATLIAALNQEISGLNLHFFTSGARVRDDLVYLAIEERSGQVLASAAEHGEVMDRRPLDWSYPCLYPLIKGGASRGRREASVIHDISTLTLPETHTSENVSFHLDSLEADLRSSEVVFCVSLATQDALCAAFPTIARKSRLLPPCALWRQEFLDQADSLSPVGLDNFALVLGSIEIRKNLEFILRAFARPEIMECQTKIVVSGQVSEQCRSIFEAIPDQAKDRIIFTGYVEEVQKICLLKLAKFLIFPSIYEGFGLPALEAISMGTPVLASMSSSFPEVIGEGGRFFDPYSEDDFVRNFVKFYDVGSYAAMRTAAAAQATCYSAEKTVVPIVDWLTGLR